MKAFIHVSLIIYSIVFCMLGKFGHNSCRQEIVYRDVPIGVSGGTRRGIGMYAVRPTCIGMYREGSIIVANMLFVADGYLREGSSDSIYNPFGKHCNDLVIMEA